MERLIYSDKGSSFEELLEKENSVPMYHTNVSVLAIIMYKVYMGSSKELMSEIFPLRLGIYPIFTFRK